MPDKNEKNKRKQVFSNLRKKSEEEFESSLPMSRDSFKKLFDYFDTELSENDCDDTNRLTKSYLEQIGIANSQEVLGWLAEKGGHCDCEILANVEEQFE